jgi:dTDP-glucose pyrophosphorylase
MSHDWRNILLNSTQKVREALAIIDSESLRIALVVDEGIKLLGVITDGDIRRGLLHGITLESNVREVMNATPLTAEHGTSRNELVKMMRKHDLLSIPLLHNNEVVGLETLLEFRSDQDLQNPIFIMAGGFGSRLRPLTNDCPKPLLKLGGKPLLEILLNSFIKCGFVNFYISTHFLPQMIRDYFGDGRKWNVSIKYVHEETPLGTGGALGLLPKDIPKLPIILINGDILTKVNFHKLLEFHDKNPSTATMCVRDYEFQVPFGVVNGAGSNVASLEEKPIHRFFINAGIYVINPEVLESVAKNIRLDMPTMLQERINNGCSVGMFPIHEYWLDIGRHEDYARAQQDIKSLGLLS